MTDKTNKKPLENNFNPNLVSTRLLSIRDFLRMVLFGVSFGLTTKI